jgi:transcription elongation GreA/GreB family factor
MSIPHAGVNDSLQSPRDEVVPGAIVGVKDLEDGASEEFTIVGIREVDYEAGKIFVDSPLALGLLGKKVSDKVSIKIPAGTLNLEILSIRFEQK